jgi:hypothetical protein
MAEPVPAGRNVSGGDSAHDPYLDRPFLMTEPIVAVLVTAALAGFGVLLGWARKRQTVRERK